MKTSISKTTNESKICECICSIRHLQESLSICNQHWKYICPLLLVACQCSHKGIQYHNGKYVFFAQTQHVSLDVWLIALLHKARVTTLPCPGLIMDKFPLATVAQMAGPVQWTLRRPADMEYWDSGSALKSMSFRTSPGLSSFTARVKGVPSNSFGPSLYLSLRNSTRISWEIRAQHRKAAL